MFANVKEKLHANAPECLLENPNEDKIIQAMIDAPNRGDRLWDKLEIEFGCNAGLFFHIKEIIKELNAANKMPSDPRKAAADARMDRLLRIRPSSGRAIARR